MDFELGTTAANRINIRYRGLPEPDSWTYSPYAVTRTAGNGQLLGFGFATFTWSWQTLSQFEVNILLGFLTAAQAAASVHVRTHIDTGNLTQTTTGTAFLQRVVDGNGKSMISETRKPSYTGVTATFVHFT